jgi:hypothetical protein
MSYAARSATGGPVNTIEDSPQADWRQVPARKVTSSFESWAAEQGESKNIEDRRPVEEGNIDIESRFRSRKNHARHNDGSVSTIYSMSIEEDGKEVLIPRVHNGEVVSEKEAIAIYRRSGKHLGKFRNSSDATNYAVSLSESYDNVMFADDDNAPKSRFINAPKDGSDISSIGEGRLNTERVKPAKAGSDISSIGPGRLNTRRVRPTMMGR